jgi:2-polyprenyl-6-hydroxyphenyl methylase/3-demethylubiquinone-9 3-methyltransferase
MAGSELEGYYDEYWRREAPPPCDDPLAGTRLTLLREELQRLRSKTEASSLRVLEAGCGAGGLVAALADDGHEAVGMDVSEAAVRLAGERHPAHTFIRHSVEEVPWPTKAESFDAVVAFEVIEHLLRPRRLLAGANTALAPGGHVALTTPYHGLLKNLALAAAAFDRHFAVEGDHIRFFSDRALRRLLGETGFEVERLRHFGRAPGLWAGVFVWARKR